MKAALSTPKRVNVTHQKPWLPAHLILKDSDAARGGSASPPPSKDPGTSMSPGTRSTELAAILTIQRHTKTQQTKLPTAWPGFDCMGWEYDPLYDGLEWPPQHIRSAYRNIGPA